MMVPLVNRVSQEQPRQRSALHRSDRNLSGTLSRDLGKAVICYHSRGGDHSGKCSRVISVR